MSNSFNTIVCWPVWHLLMSPHCHLISMKVHNVERKEIEFLSLLKRNNEVFK